MSSDKLQASVMKTLYDFGLGGSTRIGVQCGIIRKIRGRLNVLLRDFVCTVAGG